MKNFFKIIFVLSSLLATFSARSQTTLSTGDVAFTNYTSASTAADTFSIMLLANITSGTQIIFTDGQYTDASGYFKLDASFNEWVLVWQATSNMPAYTQIKFWTNGVNCPNCAASSSHGSVLSGRGLVFSTAGDQVFACQGGTIDTTTNFRYTATTVLSGIHMNYIAATTTAANWDNGAAAAISASELPNSLTTFTNCIMMNCVGCSGQNDEWNNARYNGKVAGGPASAVRAAINDSTNWDKNDANPLSPANITVPSPETFESFSTSATGFTSNSHAFTMTPINDFSVNSVSGYGYLSSDKFIDNYTTNTSPCQLKSSTPFKISSFLFYPSSVFGSFNETNAGNISITFTGKLGGSTKFTFSPAASGFTAADEANSIDRGFSYVNFVTSSYDTIAIDELVITIGGTLNYFAIDNFSFTTATSSGSPEINLKGNGVTIVDGDNTPSPSDSTDFGSVSVCSGTIVKTFTIVNLGTAALTISSVGLSGTNSSEFSVTSSPTSPIAASDSTTFQVTFNPTGSGVRSATITVNSDDADEAAYDFAIQGTGIDPEINVTGNSVSILDEDATPDVNDHTDFGSQTIGAGTVVRTFTIQNTGSSNLTIGSLSVSGTHSADFSVTASPSSPVSASGSTTFQVTFNPSASGTRSAQISFSNNDCNESTYNFSIQGTGVTPVSLSAGDLALLTVNSDGTDSFAFILLTDVSGSLEIKFTDQGWDTLSDAFSTGSEGLITWSHTGTLPCGTQVGIYAPSSGSPTSSIGSVVKTGSFSIAAGGDQILVYQGGVVTPTFIYAFNFVAGGWDVAVGSSTSNTNIPAGLDAGVNAFTVNSHVDNWRYKCVTLCGSASQILASFMVAANYDSNDDTAYVSFPYCGTFTCNSTEINVKGNSVSIPDGDATPLPSDHTDFSTTAFSRTFTIENTGSSTLTLGSNAVSVSGTNASDFAVSVQPSTTVAASGTTTFTVTFSPSDTGTRSAILSIANDDCDENPYNFSIQGTGVAATALQFDGVNDHVLASSPTSFFGTTPTTIEFWAKNSSTFSFPMDLGFTYQLQFGNGTFYMSGFGIGAYNTGATVSTSGTVWEHFAITYDGNGTFRGYKNGSPTPNPSCSTCFSSYPAVSGDLRVGLGNNNYFTNAAIDEVRVWKEERSAAQILANYNTEIAGMDPCLDIYLKFNHGVIGGNNADDTIAIDTAFTYRSNGTLYNLALTGTTSNWVAGSGITTTASAYSPAPELALSGNNVTIADGDTIASSTDSTIFGSISVCGASRSVTYKIKNTGTATLNLTGTPKVVISGTNAADFSVTTQPASAVVVGDSTIFVITFTPSASGTRNARVTIENDDCDENPLNFGIQGTGVSTFTFSGTGNWTDVAHWSPSYPDTTVSAACTIVINGTCTIPSPTVVTIAGPITINNGHSLTIASGGIFNLSTGGILTNDGTFNNNGTVALDGSYVNNTANAFVNNGTLYGNGTIDGSVINPSGNTVAPGSSPGCMTITGSLTSPGTIAIEIAGDIACTQHDSIFVTDTAYLTGGTLDISNFTATPVQGKSYIILQADTISGSFSSIIQPVLPGNFTLAVSYTPQLVMVTVGCGVEIDVTGNLVSIADGDASPSYTDSTNFGNITPNPSRARTFKIYNYGGSSLTVDSIIVTGTHASQFVVSGLSFPDATAPSNFSAFVVTFTPVGTGIKTATITVYSDDCNEAAYDFAVEGEMVCNLVASIDSSRNISCFGAANGVAVVTATSGTNPITYLWSNAATTDTIKNLTPGTYSVIVTDSLNCTVLDTVEITQPAALNGTLGSSSCPSSNGNITISSPTGGYGTYEYTINGGSSWQSSGSFTGLSAGTYDVRMRDAAQPTCELTLNGSLTLTNTDNTPPTANCSSSPVLALDNGGNATLQVSTINNGSTDGCGSLSFGLGPQTIFDCSDIGTITITLTVTDGSNNVAICTSLLSVEDQIAPVAVCNPITVQLDNTGNYTLDSDDENDIDASTDNCSIVSNSVSPAVFTCAEIGSNSVTLTVTDPAPTQSSSCATTVTVADTVDPVAVCQNVTIALDSLGNASTTAAAVNNGSSDACGGLTYGLSPSVFDCGDVGANSVTLTVTDTYSNASTCSATVIVQDLPLNYGEMWSWESGDTVINRAGDYGSKGVPTPWTKPGVRDGSVSFTDATGNLWVFGGNGRDGNGNLGLMNDLWKYDISSGQWSWESGDTVVDQAGDYGSKSVATAWTKPGARNGSGSFIDAMGDLWVFGGYGYDGNGSEGHLNDLWKYDVSSGQWSWESGDTVRFQAGDYGSKGVATAWTKPGARYYSASFTDATGDLWVFGGFGYDGNGSGGSLNDLWKYDMSSGQWSWESGDTVVDQAGDYGSKGVATAWTKPGAKFSSISSTDATGNLWVFGGFGYDGNGNLGFMNDLWKYDISSGQWSWESGDTVVNQAGDYGSKGVATAWTKPGVRYLSTSFTDAMGDLWVFGGNGYDANGSLGRLNDLWKFDISIGQWSWESGDTVANQAGEYGSKGVATAWTKSGARYGGVSFTDATGDLWVFGGSGYDGNGALGRLNDLWKYNASSVIAYPTALCKNITVYLDNTGLVVLDSNAVDSMSFDNCSLSSFSISPDSFDCISIGDTLVTLTVTDPGNNTSSCTATVTVMDTLGPNALCNNVTVQLDATGNGTTSAALVNNGSSDACGIASVVLSQTAFVCAEVGNQSETLTVTDNNGNTSTCATTVTVEDNVDPIAICQDLTIFLDAFGSATTTNSAANNGSSDACGGLVFSLSQTTFGCGEYGTNSETLTVTDVNSNSSTCATIITVEDALPPNAICQDVTIQLDNAGNGTLDAQNDLNNASTDNCVAQLDYAASETTFDCADIATSPHSVTLTVTDQANVSDQAACNVYVYDEVDPIADCKDITVQLDNLGGYTMTASEIDDNSSDNCDPAPVLSASQTVFGCADITNNPNMVTLTVTDVYSNSSTCTALVTVEDVTDPTVTCTAITVDLGSTDPGMVTISPADVGAGSAADACGINTSLNSVTPSSFDCDDYGSNSVTLSVTDNNGNNTTCVTTVFVDDVDDPTANCTMITVFLDAGSNTTIGQDGDYTLTQTNVDAIGTTSDDNCQAQLTYSIPPTTFTCADLGTPSVTLTATDQAGNTDTEVCSVTVVDNIAPQVDCNNTTVALNTAGIYDLDIDNPPGNPDTLVYRLGTGGTYDNCTSPTDLVITSSMTHFTCANVGGPIAVTLTVTDASGNSAQKTTCTVTVVDLVPPTATCQNRTVALNAFGQYHITAPDTVDNGSTDACGLHGTTPFSLAGQLDYTCADIGSPETVTLTVMDVNSNTSTCTSVITTIDIVAPTCVGQNGFIFLDSAGKDTISFAYVLNSYYDACGIVDYELSDSTFECSQVPSVLLTLTVTDGSANTGTCTASMTIVDNTGPVAQCQDVTIYLDGSGIATTDTIAVNNNSLDQCSGSNLTFNLTPTTFNCANVFTTNIVTLTVTDIYTNNHTCTAEVTVLDIINPVAICTPLTVYLDASGGYTLTQLNEDSIDLNSTDNCSVVSNSVLQADFDCADVGSPVTVTLTVVDPSGNTDDCTTVITVLDTIKPTITCVGNQTKSTDPTFCTYTAVLTEFDPASVADNCPGTTTAYSLSGVTSGSGATTLAGVVFNKGVTTVTWTVTDASSNTATCSFTVTVNDNENPTVSHAGNVTANTSDDGGYNCDVSVTINDATFGDNCPSPTIAYVLTGATTASSTAGQVGTVTFNKGVTTITYTVTDASSNTATTAMTVTVTDDENPTAQCQNITIQLDATGNQTIVASQVNNASFDNCPDVTLAASPTAFDCGDVGNNDVTLTVTDAESLTSTCVAVVTVQDVTPPSITCNPANSILTFFGSGGAFSQVMIDNSFLSSFSDACNTPTRTASPSSFSCADVNTSITVTITVTDDNGNSSTCTHITTITDIGVPVAHCQNVTVTLDSSGSATANALSVNNGSTDNCTIIGYALSDSLFNCSDLGVQNVTLTVHDQNPNNSTCAATVTVVDNASPTAVCQDISVDLDATGNATINADMVDNGSYDNCTFTLSINVSSFTCSNVGANNVTLTVTDIPIGNTDQCVSIVTINDVTPPDAICQDVTVSLDGSGNVSTTPAALNNGSSDACGIDTMFLSQTEFTCDDVGDNVVVLVVVDNNFNIGSCIASVVVQDLIAPIANCQDISVWLDGLGGADLPTINNTPKLIVGNHDIPRIYLVDASTFLVTNTLTVTLSGFTVTGVLALTYNPADGQYYAIIRVTSGPSNRRLVTIDPTTGVATLIGGLGDAFSSITFSPDGRLFGVTGDGASVPETLYEINPANASKTLKTALGAGGFGEIICFNPDDGNIYHWSGNSTQVFEKIDTSSFTVTDISMTGPATSEVTGALYEGGGVFLIADQDEEYKRVTTTGVRSGVFASSNTHFPRGFAIISTGAVSIDDGSSDACGLASLIGSPSSFTCANLGANIVTLTVTDANTNTATCLSTVTVLDTLPDIRISGPDSVIIGDIANYSIVPRSGSGHTYLWTVVGGMINSGQGTTAVNVTWTSTGIGNVHIYDSVPTTGCVYQHDTNVFVATVRYCFFNNGRYNTPNQPGCVDVSSLANVQTLLSTPMVIGDCGRTQTLTVSDASCLINRISRMGTSFTYSGCLDSINSPFNGIPFWTDMIGEVVALGLNLRQNSSLDSFELVTRTFLTEPVLNCYFSSGPIGPGVRYTIPQSVWDALPNHTMGEVYAMANRVLGGCQQPGDASQRDILNTLVYLNEAFNGCRYLVSFSLNHLY